MKKVILTVCGLFMITALSGCYGDDSTPGGVLGLAGDALQKNNLNEFASVLIDNALEKYGNLPGMESLRSDLGTGNLSVGNPTLISQSSCGSGCTLKYYEVEILGSNKTETAEVTCEAKWVWNNFHHSQRHQITHCLITDLK